MSKTPRVDAYMAANYSDAVFGHHLADFARQLETENAEMARLLEKFQMVDSQDANDANDRVRMEFLRLCPEFIGYAKAARALLAKVEGE